MRRKLFNLVAALTLILFMALCVLWVRSYWIADAAGRFGPVKSIHSDSLSGGLSFGLYPTSSDEVIGRPLPAYYYVRDISQGSFWREIFRFEAHIDFKSGYVAIRAPHWFYALLLSAVPLRWAWVHWVYRRAMRRASQGRCAQCGYDLRATRERCPECGAVPEAPPAAAAA